MTITKEGNNSTVEEGKPCSGLKNVMYEACPRYSWHSQFSLLHVINAKLAISINHSTLRILKN
jgi:hypothetical protein